MDSKNWTFFEFTFTTSKNKNENLNQTNDI